MSQHPQQPLAPLGRAGHARNCRHCLIGLPGDKVEFDSSRVAVGFYCLATMDILGLLETQTKEFERAAWKEWLWEQHIRGAFKPSSYMSPEPSSLLDAQVPQGKYSEYDMPHIIMTYTALLSLAILRDDFTRLDRQGLLEFLKACQKGDGSFSTSPDYGDSDLRTTYCAFAICSMLNDWSAIDVPRGVAFIEACRTHEGGYGTTPHCEAQGGTTYVAIASLHLSQHITNLPATQVNTTIRWLVHNQTPLGGFCGRTNKEADACYCFWCSASLDLLGHRELVDVSALANFIARCQFKYGGIAKSPGEHPDPLHTYLSLAAIAIHSPLAPDLMGVHADTASSWHFDAFDTALNATEATALWARKYVPA